MYKKLTNSGSGVFCNAKTETNFLRNVFNIKALEGFLSVLVIVVFSSCTITKNTSSPQAFKSTVDNVNSEMGSLDNDYQLTGSGTETKNEIKVEGQSYSKYTGFGTLMGNEYAIFDNYTYTDSIGNTVEFQLKHKIGNDYNKKEYVYEVEVIKCNCGDKKLYSVVCGDNGIVKKVTQLPLDQESVFYDQGKTLSVIYGFAIGASILSLVPLLLL